MPHARGVHVTRQRHAAGRRRRPHLEAVHEHHPAGGRCGGRKQQAVIAPRADAADRAAGETAKAVGLQPLPLLARLKTHRVSSVPSMLPEPPRVGSLGDRLAGLAADAGGAALDPGVDDTAHWTQNRPSASAISPTLRPPVPLARHALCHNHVVSRPERVADGKESP